MKPRENKIAESTKILLAILITALFFITMLILDRLDLL
jgi:hypothetical protein